MLSDWIRGLRDPELLYKKLLVLADQVEGSARAAFGATCKSLRWLEKAAYWGLAGSVGTTVLAAGVWLVLLAFKVDVSWPFQALTILCGFAWALFLVFVALLLGAVEGVLAQFPRLEKALSDVKQSIVTWLRVPASIAFVTLFLAILMGRFDELRKPEAFLAILGIVVVFGLASFLGLCAVNLTWLRRAVFLCLFAAVVLLVVAPQFPHVTAWLNVLLGAAKGPFVVFAEPKRVNVDPDSPLPFFDSVTGNALLWYSPRPGGGFVLWDRPGFDTDSGERLQSVDSREKRDEILAWFRDVARRSPQLLKIPATPETNRSTRD